MDRFWRTVSIALGALLATGCLVRTKYGIADTEDTGDTAADVAPVAAPDVTEAPPLVQEPIALPVVPTVE